MSPHLILLDGVIHICHTASYPLYMVVRHNINLHAVNNKVNNMYTNNHNHVNNNKYRSVVTCRIITAKTDWPFLPLCQLK